MQRVINKARQATVAETVARLIAEVDARCQLSDLLAAGFVGIDALTDAADGRWD